MANTALLANTIDMESSTLLTAIKETFHQSAIVQDRALSDAISVLERREIASKREFICRHMLWPRPAKIRQAPAYATCKGHSNTTLKLPDCKTKEPRARRNNSTEGLDQSEKCSQRIDTATVACVSSFLQQPRMPRPVTSQSLHQRIAGGNWHFEGYACSSRFASFGQASA